MSEKKTITLNLAANGIPILQGIHASAAPAISYEEILMDLKDIEDMTKKPIFDAHFKEASAGFKGHVADGIAYAEAQKTEVLESLLKLKTIADALPASPIASFVVTQIAPFLY